MDSGLQGDRPSATSPPPAGAPVAESPQEDRPVEWWFFQGRFTRPDGALYEYMVSFFRVTISRQHEPHQNGHCLLVTLLEVATGKNYVLSRVDDLVVNGMLRRVELLEDTEIDREMQEVLYREIARHGPPRPIKRGEGPVEMLKDRLKVFWDDFALEQVDNAFFVSFAVPDWEMQVSLRLDPEYPRMFVQREDELASLGGGLLLATYPRMGLSGLLNGEHLEGAGWFDHQWGDSGWFVADSPKKEHVGWDWFGINLDDGTDIMISDPKEMRTGKVVKRRAFVHSPDGDQAEYEELQLTPLRFWESPRSHIRYPVEWRIQIPTLELDAVYKPLIDDQEIALLGVARAVWEGAGRVTGTVGGRDISGRARGEFYGYGYIFDFQEFIQRLVDKVDKHLDEFLPRQFSEADVAKFVGEAHWRHEPAAYTELLATPIWDLISRKGKRWRPVFGILMGEALGAATEHYEASTCLAEFVHSGALIIDDIQDDSLLRRGEPCIHLKYGVDVAISAGNTLYFLPSIDLVNHPHLDDLQKLRIHEIMMDTYLQAHFGQTVDIYYSKYLSRENLEAWLEGPLEDKILQLYDFKTAAMPRGLAQTASLVARVDGTVTQVCVDFSRAFAVAFQIIDDVHNFSDSPEWRKTRGEDLAGGKLTYAIVRAIRLLEVVDGGDRARRDRLVEILCSSELRRDPEVLQEGIALVKESGALEECRETARKMSLEANERFGDAIPSSEPKIMLSMLCVKMLDLAFDT
jgi:geranylgeranyl pyrophosphate synthase/predicted secreted hydrolase